MIKTIKKSTNSSMYLYGIEILCVGTELLLGNILNSNAKWLSEEIAKIGLSHYRQTVIGDNFDRLKNIIIEASNRSKILITTGGLGPTPDDLTTEAIAAAFNAKLEIREEIWKDIKKKFSNKKGSPPANNQKQAFFPKEAKIIPNTSGTAPGMIWSPTSDFTIITFPGVPSEMKQMWIDSVIPWLNKQNVNKSCLISETLRFSGISESQLSEDIKDILESKNPTVAPYASLGEVKLRITAKSNNPDEANKLITPIKNEILYRSGTKYFGSDKDSLASIVLSILKKRKQTLAIAESCTGGGIGAEITAIPGSSDVFLGGIIAYKNSIKQELLNVPENLIKKYGAVSIKVVEAMAEGTLKKFGADWSIAVSGLAGPIDSDTSKPIGLVQFCIAGPHGIHSTPYQFNSHKARLEIQKLSVLKSLDLLRLFLLKTS